MRIPLSEKIDQQDGIVRIFMSPQYVRYKGILQHIKSNLRLEEIQGGFQINFLGDWLRFIPTAATRAALELATKRIKVEGYHFGYMLDAARKPDQLEFLISASEGANAQRVANGWELAPGIGLYFDDWERNWPNKVFMGTTRIILDLTGAVPDENGEIDLDPNQISEAEFGRVHTAAGVDWPALLNAGASFTSHTSIKLDIFESGGTYFNTRIVFRFDTRGYGGALSAKLVVHRKEGTTDVGVPNPYVSLASFAAGELSTETNYGAVKTGLDANNKHQMSIVSGDEFNSPDFVAASDWSAEEKFDLGIYDNTHDGAGEAVPPPNNQDKLQFAAVGVGGEDPYLRIEPAGAGRTLLGAGK